MASGIGTLSEKIGDTSQTGIGSYIKEYFCAFYREWSAVAI